MTEARETSRFASRKFILAVLVIVIGVAMTLEGKFSGDHLVDLLKWIAGLYFGFNVTAKASEWLASKGP